MKIRFNLALATLFAVLLAQFLIHYHIGTGIFFQDEHVFLSEANWVLQGAIPHRDYFLERPPTFIFFVSFIFLAFGKSFLAARLIMALICMATTVCVYLIGRKLFDEKAGLLAAALFVFTEPSYLSFMVLSDSSIALSLALGFLALLYNPEEDTKKSLLAGLLFGLQLTLRQVGLPAVAAGAFFIWYQSKNKSARSVAKPLACFFIGSAVPLLLTLLFYLAVGGLDKLIYNTTSYSNGYLESLLLEPIRTNPVAYISSLAQFLMAPFVFFFAFMLGGMAERRKTLYLALLTFSGLISMFPNFVMNHMLPSQVGISIVVAAVLLESFKMKGLLPILFLCFTVFQVLLRVSLSVYVAFFASPDFGTTEISPAVFFPAASYINSHTAPDEKFLSFMHFPLYYAAERFPGSYYHYADKFCSDEKIEQQIIYDIEKGKVSYVVHEKIYGKGLESYCKGDLFRYLNENYHVETVFTGAESGIEVDIMRRN